MLLQPKKLQYDSHDLISSIYQDYKIREYALCSDGVNLHCARWDRNNHDNIFVLYLHTNTRALIDAKEGNCLLNYKCGVSSCTVALSFCSIINASLISFDLRGCGKSEGNLCFSMVKDLENVVQHITSNHTNAKIVLWARGMATALALEYCSTLTKHTSPIVFMILDSPFVSAEKMVNDAAASVSQSVVYVPSFLVNVATNKVRRMVQSRLGQDPYTIKPIEYASQVTVPCFIFAAEDDDYIPCSHGRQMGEAMTQCKYWLKLFKGKHFGERSFCPIALSKAYLDATFVPHHHVTSSHPFETDKSLSVCSDGTSTATCDTSDKSDACSVRDASDVGVKSESSVDLDMDLDLDMDFGVDMDESRDSKQVESIEGSSKRGHAHANFNARASAQVCKTPPSGGGGGGMAFSPMMRARSSNSLSIFGGKF